MNKYKFTKKYNWWNTDHVNNFDFIKGYFKKIYKPSYGLNFLEIGVFEGKTSCWIIDNILEDAMGMLQCIDPNLTKNGKYNLSLHLGNIIYHNEPSSKALIELIHENIFKFDFIYVDGDHNACGLLEDLVLSWKMLKEKGVMLIDDYEMEATDPWFYRSHPEFKDHPRLRFIHPRIAIDAFLSIYRGQYDMVINNYQIGLKKTVTFG